MPAHLAKPLLAIGRQLSFLLIGIAVYCIGVDLVIRWWKIEKVHEWGVEASLVNGVILGLLMGFRNRAAFDRWWEGRKLWGQLVNDSRNLAAKLGAFLPADAVARSPAPRLLIGFARALKRHLRSEPLQPGDLPGLEAELERDRPAHVPAYLIGRLYEQIATWRHDGLIDDATLWVLDPHLRALHDILGGCERIRNTPLPPSYVILLRTGLALNLLVAPWYTISEVGLVSVPAFLLVSFFLLGVELIDTTVEEPFGREQDDLDLDGCYRTILRSVEQSLPLTLPPKS